MNLTNAEGSLHFCALVAGSISIESLGACATKVQVEQNLLETNNVVISSLVCFEKEDVTLGA